MSQTKLPTPDKDRSPAVPKSILKRRPTQTIPEKSMLVTDPEVTSNQDEFPDYIVPWGSDPEICGNCAASAESDAGGDDTSHVPDSGVVIIPADNPPPLDNHPQLDPRTVIDHDSAIASTSSSYSTHKSLGHHSMEMDDDLLSDAEACLNLEAYLSTGHYFNAESVAHDGDHVLEPMLEHNPSSSVPDSSSLLSNTSDPVDEVQETQSSIEVPDRESPIDVPSHDNLADWSFENDLTLAVLDAMDQRSKSPPKSPLKEETELGVLASPELAPDRELGPSPDRPRLGQTRNSIQNTFERFRRRIRPV